MNPFRSGRVEIATPGQAQQLLRLDGSGPPRWRLLEVDSPLPVELSLSWTVPTTFERTVRLTLAQGRICVLAQHLTLKAQGLHASAAPYKVLGFISDAFSPSANVLDELHQVVDENTPLVLPVPAYARAVRVEDSAVMADLLNPAGVVVGVVPTSHSIAIGQSTHLRLAAPSPRAVRVVFYLSL